jgi:hypothetical protein
LATCFSEILAVRPVRILIVVLGLGCAFAVTYWPYLNSGESGDADSNGTLSASGASALPVPRQQRHSPVLANRSPEVLEGFRGETHPLLYGATILDVNAHWSPVGKGRDKIEERIPPEAYALYRNVKPAKANAIYTQRDLSVFLPERVASVGQMWTLDPERVALILKQFHPDVSMQALARGRRSGPDGAFGILRAISDDYLDIVCRIHTEFNFTPAEFRRSPRAPRLWYTPAYLSGRLLVNRKTGTIDYFRIGLPTDKTLNVHLTAAVPPYGEHHDIVRVERMELEGGNHMLLGDRKWDSSIDPAHANARLAQQFYKFNDVAWVPTHEALAAARQHGRPILGIVTWGSLDDQSC